MGHYPEENAEVNVQVNVVTQLSIAVTPLA
jgi:hypothetical protein